MPSGLKAAITILGVLLVLAVVCGGGIFAFYRFGRGSLSDNVLAIQMHDEHTVSNRHYVSSQLQCRIRLPEGVIQIKTGQNPSPESLGDFVAIQATRSIVVSMADRGFYSFDSYVRQNRAGIAKTSGLANVRFFEEGRCNVGGYDGYVLTIACDIGGRSMKQRMVALDAPNKKVYILVGSSLASDWGTNVDVLDSSMSTFEVGVFAEDPPEAPRFQNLGGNPAAPNFGDPRPLPPVPQPPALHLTFDNGTDALKYLRTGRPEERRAALSYMEQTAPDAALHDQVMPELVRLLGDNTLRGSALNAVKTWATKADAAMLRGEFERRVQMDPSGRAGDTIEERRVLMGLLAADGDVDAARTIAQSLRNPSLRTDAEDALTVLGAASEPGLDEMVAAPDADTAREAMKLLGTLGTQTSVMPLQRITFGKDTGLASAATDTINQIATRLKLKPDEYKFNLIGHYEIAPPTGYTPDSITALNTRQWSHAASGRAVRAVLQVSVKLVPAGFHLNFPPGSNVVAAGTIEFHQMDTSNTNLSKSVHYTALDGEYLIDLTATVDNADPAQGNLLTAAVKKIHAVGP